MDKLASGGLGLLNRLLPTITQLCLVAAATVTTFGYPLLFGLSAYGTFAAACALTFVVHRAVDLVLESMIADRSVAYIATFAAVFIVLAAIIFMMLPMLLNYDLIVIRPLLLSSLIASTAILNITFKIGSVFQQALFSAIFLCATTIICIAYWLFGWSNIENMVVSANLISAVIGVLIFLPKLRGLKYQSLLGSENVKAGQHTKLMDTIYRIGFSSFSLLLGFGTIVVAGGNLNAVEAGTLRLFSSLIVLGVWITPINPKLYYSVTSGVDTVEHLIRKLWPYLGSLALALFAWWLAVTVLVGAGLSETYGSLAMAAASYPAVILSTIMDKVVLAKHGVRKSGLSIFILSAIVIVALLSTQSVEAMMLVVLGSVAVYPVALAVLLLPSFIPAALITLSLASCAALALQLGDIRFLALAFLVMSLSVFLVGRLHRTGTAGQDES